MKTWLAILALALSLPACASSQLVGNSVASSVAATSPPNATAYRKQLQLQGRIAVRFQQEGQEQHLNANFHWQQEPEQVRVLLATPLGQAQAEILVTANQASLIVAGQPPRSAANIDQLTQEILGWPLPVAGLRDWLQGQGHDAQGRRFFANPNNSDTIHTADGWRIRFVSWHTPQQPKRIDLEHQVTGQASEVFFRIVLDAE